MHEDAFPYYQTLGAEERNFYGDRWHLLEDVINEFLGALSGLRRRCILTGAEDPVMSCRARIKSADSMREKLARYRFPVTADSAMKNVFDAAGVRVICPFVEDIHQVVGMIHTLRDVEVLQEKDYIRHPKPSGYRSYHLILRMPLRTGDHEPVALEVQIRTIAMDCWASIEHGIKYKQNVPNADILSRELRRCASEIAAADLSLQTLRELVRESW